jgi:hypothetical protein
MKEGTLFLNGLGESNATERAEFREQAAPGRHRGTGKTSGGSRRIE